MSTAITRLRRWCEPVREDTPQLPLDRQDRVTVSKSDLLQLLADYDALQTDYDRLNDAYDVLAGSQSA